MHHQGREDGLGVGVAVGAIVGDDVGVGVPAVAVGSGEAEGVCVGAGVDKFSTQPTAAQAFILP